MLSPELKSVLLSIVPVLAGAVVTLATTHLANSHSRKQAMFSSFLERKVAAYENYIAHVMSATIGKNVDTEKMLFATSSAHLFSPELLHGHLRELSNIVVELDQIYKEKAHIEEAVLDSLLAKYHKERDIVIKGFRADIQDCARFKIK